MENKILVWQTSAELRKIYQLESDLQIDEGNELEVTLDYMSWGKKSNLHLYFNILDLNKKIRLSVYNRNSYMDRRENISFKDANLLGRNFIINLKKTKNNYFDLIKARLK